MVRIIVSFVFLIAASSTNAQDIRRVKITDVEKIIVDSKKPLIVNMWATWCKPCIEEIPYFLEEVKKQNEKGDSVQIILVSMDFKEDYPATIKSFVVKRNYNVPVLWLDETNADYFCPRIDPKWSGACPSSLFVNNQSGYRNFIEGQIKHDDLKKRD